MEWNKRFTYPKSVRSLKDGQRHYDVGNEKLPSVTTILAATQSDEKRESLAKWIAKKGKNEADRVKNEAAKRGSAMHSILEHHILGNNTLDLTDVAKRHIEWLRWSSTRVFLILKKCGALKWFYLILVCTPGRLT